MPIHRFSLSRRRWLPVALAASMAIAFPSPNAGAEPPVPPVAEQLARAQGQKDPASVCEICRRALEKGGGDAPGLLATLYRAQLELKDFPRAAETLARLQKVSTAPSNATAAELRGDLLKAEGKGLDEVLAAWREAAQADPEDLPGLEGKIADALDAAGRWEEAAAQFRAVLHLVPGHAARQARLAVCVLNAGHSCAEAEKEMQAALRTDPADDTVKAAAPLFDRLRPQLPLLGRLEGQTVRFPGGVPTNDVSPKANTFESACLDRALILYRAGCSAGALIDAERAARATHGQAVAVRLLQAQCLWRLDRDKEAVALQAAKINNVDWFNDTERFNRLRTADKAVAANSSPPATAKAHTVRATVMLEADQSVLALEEARRAHELSESGGLRLDDTEVVLAVALLRNDRPAEALAAARRATEFAPKNPDGWAILGRLEQETRADFAAAAEHLSRALSLREEPRWLQRREVCLRTLGRNAEADHDAQRLSQLPPAS